MESLDVKKFLATTMLVAGLAVLTISSANATSISFANPTGPLGTSQAYGPVTAYGFTAKLSGPYAGSLKAADLFGKNGGGDENGLGLFYTNDNEINAPAGTQAIVLDVSKLMGDDLMIGFGSVQAYEAWQVGFSSSYAMPPTNESAFGSYVTGHTEFPYLFDLGVNNSRYLIIEAAQKDVLLTSLSYTEVPEPASMALLGAGLVGMGYFRRRASRA